jgi:hypothetical protein
VGFDGPITERSLLIGADDLGGPPPCGRHLRRKSADQHGVDEEGKTPMIRPHRRSMSVSSTLFAHFAHAFPTSETIDTFDADRRNASSSVPMALTVTR